MNKVDWKLLSKNPNAMSILENNLDKINWDILCLNPSLFIETYNIKNIPESPHKELLAMKAFCPERIFKCLKLGYEIEDL